MKLQTDTNQKPPTIMLRARVNRELKDRVAKHAEKIERDESYIIRKAVEQFLKARTA